jgi:acyl-CoA synthetase (AMP-forming)/AMP-acid ligase II
VRDYFRTPTPGELTADGWFRTGDVATIDPDAMEFVGQLPHTATGKILKTQLRKDFEGYSVAQGPTHLFTSGLSV